MMNFAVTWIIGKNKNSLILLYTRLFCVGHLLLYNYGMIFL